jgi:hypothetical protein
LQLLAGQFRQRIMVVRRKVMSAAGVPLPQARLADLIRHVEEVQPVLCPAFSKMTRIDCQLVAFARFVDATGPIRELGHQERGRV